MTTEEKTAFVEFYKLDKKHNRLAEKFAELYSIDRFSDEAYSTFKDMSTADEEVIKARENYYKIKDNGISLLKEKMEKERYRNNI